MSDQTQSDSVHSEGAEYDNSVNKMVANQTRALAICGGLMLFGFLAIAMNIRTIMAMEYPILAIVVAQIPAAVAGGYLGWVLMAAGRSENIRETDE
ncbi:MAG: hypothetical protein ABF310_08340 [Paracoccaceae bacterium]|jgi:hypothetical protein